MPSDQPANLRLSIPGDEQALALIGAATFLESFAGFLEGADVLAHCFHQHAASKYAAWLSAPGTHLCLAEVRGAPVGYSMLCPPDLPIPTHPSDIELKRIYLLHRFQKSGIGAALMSWSIEHAAQRNMQRLLLGVNAGNQSALAFYARHGFEKVGTRQFLVGASLNDDLILARSL